MDIDNKGIAQQELDAPPFEVTWEKFCEIAMTGIVSKQDIKMRRRIERLRKRKKWKNE